MATDFAYNYRTNLFFRTKAKVLGLLSLLLVFIGATGVIFLRRVLVLTEELFVAEIKATSGVRTRTIEHAISAAWEQIPLSEFFVPLGVLVLGTIVLSLWIARIALRPTRDALTLQKQFIGNIAHELRTPLAIMKTNIEVALLEEGIHSSLRKTLKENAEELDRSADIINNLLTLNTLMDPSVIPFSDVDLGVVAEKARTMLLPLSQKRRVEVTLIKRDFLIVRGNETALVQVAVNMIKNALIHSEVGGGVTVAVQPDYRGYIELRVTDTGEGIPPDDLLHIFEPFYQADTARKKTHGGAGLGLTIVSEIVKLHGGRIVLQSKRERGTMIQVAIPCGNTPSTEDVVIGDDLEKVAIDFSGKEHPQRSTKNASR